MRVILLQRIKKLGNVGDTVIVKRGYARNYLIPSSMAVKSTPESIKHFEVERVALEQKAALVLTEAEKRAKSLAGFSVTIQAQSSDQGKLYGSLGPREIADAVTEKGYSLAKSEVIMPEGPIRTIGEFEVLLQLHSEVSVPITVIVAAA